MRLKLNLNRVKIIRIINLLQNPNILDYANNIFRFKYRILCLELDLAMQPSMNVHSKYVFFWFELVSLVKFEGNVCVYNRCNDDLDMWSNMTQGFFFVSMLVCQFTVASFVQCACRKFTQKQKLFVLRSGFPLRKKLRL